MIIQTPSLLGVNNGGNKGQVQSFQYYVPYTGATEGQGTRGKLIFEGTLTWYKGGTFYYLNQLHTFKHLQLIAMR